MEVFVIYRGLPIKKGHFSTLTPTYEEKKNPLRTHNASPALLVTLNCPDLVFIFVISRVNRNMCSVVMEISFCLN